MSEERVKGREEKGPGRYGKAERRSGGVSGGRNCCGVIGCASSLCFRKM